jgi:glutamine cyclotransferase
MLTVSCVDAHQNKSDGKDKRSIQTRFSLVSPRNGQTIKDSESVSLEIHPERDSVSIDSCRLSVDGRHFVSFDGCRTVFRAGVLRMGLRRMALSIFTSDGLRETVSFNLKIVPDQAPKQCSYSVVGKYPHDTKAYTQGLFWNDGHLYEGTGQYGASSLRRVELSTGKVVKSIQLEAEYFGEGVCLHQGKIYQLTWQNRKGFIYRADSLILENRFEYSTEGWGITSDGERLFMSDGSANIYLVEPSTMSVADLVEVWTPSGKVNHLNELEYIDGELWANVYMEDYIIRIDPATGRVNSIIDLKNLLPMQERKPDTDVLNGIAYDSINRRIFVTGKNWPFVFEISIK